MKSVLLKAVTDLARLTEDFATANENNLSEAAAAIARALGKGHKLLAFGNGGSAADAQHLVAELVNRYRVNRRALAAVALTADSAVLTSIGNDLGFDRIFARQVEALGRMDDVAVAISTSGTSPNVIEGVAAARRLGMFTIGLCGQGGTLARDCDLALVVPSIDTPRIQECHSLAIHVLCEFVERELGRVRE